MPLIGGISIPSCNDRVEICPGLIRRGEGGAGDHRDAVEVEEPFETLFGRERRHPTERTSTSDHLIQLVEKFICEIPDPIRPMASNINHPQTVNNRPAEMGVGGYEFHIVTSRVYRGAAGVDGFPSISPRGEFPSHPLTSFPS